jgi:hypothetical protein
MMAHDLAFAKMEAVEVVKREEEMKKQGNK